MSSHPCNLNFSEALYNKVLGITNNTPAIVIEKYMEIYRYLVSLSSLGPSLYRGSTVLPLQYYLLAISNLLKTHLNLIKIIILALES